MNSVLKFVPASMMKTVHPSRLFLTLPWMVVKVSEKEEISNINFVL